MNEFFQIALSMPTVVFSALLVVLSLYWGLVVLGALDLDFADFDLDFDLDTDLGVEADIEMDIDVDVEAEVAGSHVSFLAGVASMLGLGTVPVTVVVSVSTLFGWLISFLAVFYLRSFLGGAPTLGALLIGLGSAALSLLPTMLLSKPLKRLFETREGPPGGRALIGTVCVVASSRVDLGFGRGTVEDDGAGLILPIRCDDTSNRLSHGSQAIIIDFDSAQNIYMVETYDVFLGKDAPEKAFDLAQNISRAFQGSETSSEQKIEK